MQKSEVAPNSQLNVTVSLSTLDTSHNQGSTVFADHTVKSTNVDSALISSGAQYAVQSLSRFKSVLDMTRRYLEDRTLDSTLEMNVVLQMSDTINELKTLYPKCNKSDLTLSTLTENPCKQLMDKSLQLEKSIQFWIKSFPDKHEESAGMQRIPVDIIKLDIEEEIKRINLMLSDQLLSQNTNLLRVSTSSNYYTSESAYLDEDSSAHSFEDATALIDTTTVHQISQTTTASESTALMNFDSFMAMLSDFPTRKLLNNIKLQEFTQPFNNEDVQHEDVQHIVSILENTDFFNALVVFSELMKEFILIINSVDRSVASDYQKILNSLLDSSEKISGHDRFKRGARDKAVATQRLMKSIDKFVKLKYGEGLKYFYQGFIDRARKVSSKLSSWKELGAVGEEEGKKFLKSPDYNEYSSIFELLSASSPDDCRLAGTMAFNLNLASFSRDMKRLSPSVHHNEDYLLQYRELTQAIISYDDITREKYQVASLSRFELRHIFTFSVIVSEPFLVSICQGSSAGYCAGGAIFSELSDSSFRVIDNLFYEMYKSQGAARTVQAISIIQNILDKTVFGHYLNIPQAIDVLGIARTSLTYRQIFKVFENHFDFFNDQNDFDHVNVSTMVTMLIDDFLQKKSSTAETSVSAHYLIDLLFSVGIAHVVRVALVSENESSYSLIYENTELEMITITLDSIADLNNRRVKRKFARAITSTLAKTYGYTDTKLYIKKIDSQIINAIEDLVLIPDSNLTLKDIANTPHYMMEQLEFQRNKEFFEHFFDIMKRPEVVELIQGQPQPPKYYKPGKDVITVDSPIFLQMREIVNEVKLNIESGRKIISVDTMLLFHNIHQLMGTSFSILVERMKDALKGSQAQAESESEDDHELQIEDLSYVDFLDLIAKEDKENILNWLPAPLRDGAPGEGEQLSNSVFAQRFSTNNLIDYLVTVEKNKKQVRRSRTRKPGSKNDAFKNVAAGVASAVGATSAASGLTWFASKSSGASTTSTTGNSVLDSLIDQYVSDVEAMQAADQEINPKDNTLDDQLPDTPDHEPGDGTAKKVEKPQAVRCRRSVGCGSITSGRIGSPVSSGIKFGGGALAKGLTSICGSLFFGGSGLISLAGGFFSLFGGGDSNSQSDSHEQNSSSDEENSQSKNSKDSSKSQSAEEENDKLTSTGSTKFSERSIDRAQLDDGYNSTTSSPEMDALNTAPLGNSSSISDDEMTTSRDLIATSELTLEDNEFTQEFNGASQNPNTTWVDSSSSNTVNHLSLSSDYDQTTLWELDQRTEMTVEVSEASQDNNTGPIPTTTGSIINNHHRHHHAARDRHKTKIKNQGNKPSSRNADFQRTTVPVAKDPIRHHHLFKDMRQVNREVPEARTLNSDNNQNEPYADLPLTPPSDKFQTTVLPAEVASKATSLHDGLLRTLQKPLRLLIPSLQTFPKWIKHSFYSPVQDKLESTLSLVMPSDEASATLYRFSSIASYKDVLSAGSSQKNTSGTGYLLQSFDKMTPGCADYSFKENDRCQMLKSYKVNDQAADASNDLSTVNDKNALYGEVFRSWQNDRDLLNNRASILTNLPLVSSATIETRLKLYQKATGHLPESFSMDSEGRLTYAKKVNSDTTCYQNGNTLDCKIYPTEESLSISDIIKEVDSNLLNDKRNAVSHRIRQVGEAAFGMSELLNVGIHWMNDRIIPPSHIMNAYHAETSVVLRNALIPRPVTNLLLDCLAVAPVLSNELADYAQNMESEQWVSPQWSVDELLSLAILSSRTDRMNTPNQFSHAFLNRVLDPDSGLLHERGINLFSLNEHDGESQVRSLKTNRQQRQTDSFLISSAQGMVPCSGNKRPLIQLMLDSMAEVVINQENNEDKSIIERASTFQLQQKKQGWFSRTPQRNKLEAFFKERLDEVKQKSIRHSEYLGVISNLILISQLMSDCSADEQQNLVRWLMDKIMYQNDIHPDQELTLVENQKDLITDVVNQYSNIKIKVQKQFKALFNIEQSTKQVNCKISALALTILDAQHITSHSSEELDKIVIEVLIEQWLEDQDIVSSFLASNPAIKAKLDEGTEAVEYMVTRSLIDEMQVQMANDCLSHQALSGVLQPSLKSIRQIFTKSG